MRADQLPSLHKVYSWGSDIRMDVAQLISTVQLNAKRGPGGAASAVVARDFFIAAASYCHAATNQAGTVGVIAPSE